MNDAAHRLGAGGLAVAAFAPSWNETRRAADCGTLIRAGRCARRLGKWLLLLGALLLGASAASLLARHGLVMFNLPWLATMASFLVFPSGWATAVAHPHVQRMRRLFAGRCAANPLTPAWEGALRAPLVRLGLKFAPLLVAMAIASGVWLATDWPSVTAALALTVPGAALAATYLPTLANSSSRASVAADGRSPRVLASASRQRR